MLKRLFAFIFVFSLSLGLIAPAQAAANPWTWTDLSNQLASRQNRSIKAMAYGGGYWYYTDSEDLWNGGQVYRYDGSNQTNITIEVRNAGLTRVDDIVSDGQSIWFLQDVVRTDNQVRIVSYTNSSYTNITDKIRNSLQSNEGIGHISGRNGTWYIVTTKTRLLRVTSNAEWIQEISIPSELRNSIPSNSTMLYSLAQGFPSYDYLLGILPINNDWLLYGRIANQMVIYRYNGATFTEIWKSSKANGATFDASASNGSKVIFIIGTTTAGGGYSNAYEYDGTTFKIMKLYNWSDYHSPYGGGPDQALVSFDQNSTLVGNASGWMLLNKKKLLRIDVSSQSIQNLGRMQDYFVTAAGNQGSDFLIGGAVSETSLDNPTSPLTAKLVKVTENYVYTPPTTPTYPSGQTTSVGNQTYTSSYGPTMYVQGTPADFRVGNGGTFVYRVTASDPDGVDRIDLYVNNGRIKTCYSSVCDFEAVYYTNGLPSRTVPFWARTTDKQGYSTDSMNAQNILTIDNYSSASAVPGSSTTGGTTTGSQSNTGSTGSYLTPDQTINRWQWLNPNTGTLQQDQSITYTVTAQANQGLQRIEIWVNGVVRQTCQLFNSTTNQTCSFTLVGSQYPLGTQVAFNARIIDSNNKEAWTTLSYVTVTTAGTSGQTSGGTQTSSALPPATWVWSIPPAANTTISSKVTYHVGAWDADGISKIEIWVNGTIRRTCNFPNTLGNVECAWEVYPQDYPNGTEVFVNARAVDAKGVETWAASQSYRVQK